MISALVRRLAKSRIIVGIVINSPEQSYLLLRQGLNSSWRVLIVVESNRNSGIDPVEHSFP